ncbi:MAG TPA: SDR family NAD(P)-dependent oxidoreductase [Acidobacteriota bacterium]|nr:SDR family NAD(P)-dependent oxidoreductase [Acidobacteriota bacterium]
MELKEKNALITGGCRGIGRAISLALAEKGVNVAVHYLQNAEAADLTTKKIIEKGLIAEKVQADVRDFAQVLSMMKTVKKSMGSLQILVNNAGLSGANSSLLSIEEAEWREVLDVNLTGVFNCSRAAVLEFRKDLKKIVNISSIAGKMGGTIGCHYAASKAGVIGMTFALARELAPDMWVNAVAPGPVDTGFLSPEKEKKLSQATPFGRIASPEEIAHTVLYLLENDYVSGEVIDVNAGRYMD